MSSLNQQLSDLDNRSKALAQELELFLKEYSSVELDLKKRYKEELNYSGSLEGLGLFGALNNTLTRNVGSLKNAVLLIKKLKGVSIYNISEVEEEIVNADISRLMK